MSDPRNTPELVAQFLSNVRGTVPLAIEQIEAMLQLIAAACDGNVRRVLDLGCGDGVLSSAVLDEYPEARTFLVDRAPAFLEAARKRLASHVDRASFVHTDFYHAGWERHVAPDAPFDAVVSGFSIHPLTDARQRELFSEVRELLAPEGIFIVIEHVASATRWTESQCEDWMIDAIFGEVLRDSPGKSRAEVAREYYARTGARTAEAAPLEVQCDWLREAGFEHVECFLKVQELAVFGGQRPAQ